MTSLIEQIKAKIDVVEEIGLVVALQKAGKSYRGHCPFHNERTPSFHVFAESQTWRCFGCNEGGDVFTFVEKQQGLDFRAHFRSDQPLPKNPLAVACGEVCHLVE